MPRIPTYTRRDPRRVIGPALTDPSGARVAGYAPARGAANKARGEQAMWRGVQKLGQDITQFVDQKIQENETLKDNNASIKAARRRELAEREYELAKVRTPHTEWAKLHAEIFQKARADNSALQFGTERAQQASMATDSFWTQTTGAAVRVNADKAFRSESIGLAENDYAITMAKYGPEHPNTIVAENRARSSYSTFGYPPEVSDASIAKIAETSQKQYDAAQFEADKDTVIALARSGNPDNVDVKEFVNSLTDDPSERAALDDAYRLALDQKAQAQKQTEHQKWGALNSQITAGALDPKSPDALSYESVIAMDLSDKDQAKWLGQYDEDKDEIIPGYIQGMYKDPPSETTYDGYKMATKTVQDVASLQISPTMAYDRLLTARFKDFTITDKQFNWAMEKIDKPYPKTVADPLQQTVEANKARRGYSDDPFFKSFVVTDNDEKVEQDINTSLYAWVDNEMANGNEPTQREMEKQSQYFRYGKRSLVELGQVVNRGELE